MTHLLLFDVFGTVVDWRGTIMREGKGPVDWAAFADRWRAGYKPAMERTRNGEWARLDDLHRQILDEVLAEFGISGLSEEEKDHWNRVWHRLQPWPDSIAGLVRLRERYTIATLSNGNMSMLVNMAKNAGLPWDAVLSAELFRRYKPDREVYLGAARLLGYPPDEVMMVAAHAGDLKAARDCGMRTAFVHRPLEYGPGGRKEIPDGSDVAANDFLDLASQLGA